MLQLKRWVPRIIVTPFDEMGVNQSRQVTHTMTTLNGSTVGRLTPTVRALVVDDDWFGSKINFHANVGSI